MDPDRCPKRFNRKSDAPTVKFPSKGPAVGAGPAEEPEVRALMHLWVPNLQFGYHFQLHTARSLRCDLHASIRRGPFPRYNIALEASAAITIARPPDGRSKSRTSTKFCPDLYLAIKSRSASSHGTARSRIVKANKWSIQRCKLSREKYLYL
jgi:hypothetical protein